jgi:phage-related holin
MQSVMDRKEGITLMTLVRHYTTQLLDGFSIKVLWSVLGGLLVSVEGFYTELVWGFLAFFAIDFATGVAKSYKNGVPITSRRLRESVIKLLGYMMLITALIIAGKYESVFATVVPGAYVFFMLTEFKSIIENVEEMGVKVPSIIKTLINLRLNFHDKGNQVATKEAEKDAGTNKPGS